jgi:hypothetical protein
MLLNRTVSDEPTAWSFLAWLVGGALVGALTGGLVLGVLVAVTGGDSTAAGYAIGFGIIGGGFLGALVGGLWFFLKYALGR